jgi:hypothetical protein
MKHIRDEIIHLTWSYLKSKQIWATSESGSYSENLKKDQNTVPRSGLVTLRNIFPHRQTYSHQPLEPDLTQLLTEKTTLKDYLLRQKESESFVQICANS